MTALKGAKTTLETMLADLASGQWVIKQGAALRRHGRSPDGVHVSAAEIENGALRLVLQSYGKHGRLTDHSFGLDTLSVTKGGPHDKPYYAVRGELEVLRRDSRGRKQARKRTIALANLYKQNDAPLPRRRLRAQRRPGTMIYGFWLE